MLPPHHSRLLIIATTPTPTLIIAIVWSITIATMCLLTNINNILFSSLPLDCHLIIESTLFHDHCRLLIIASLWLPESLLLPSCDCQNPYDWPLVIARIHIIASLWLPESLSLPSRHCQHPNHYRQHTLSGLIWSSYPLMIVRSAFSSLPFWLFIIISPPLHYCQHCLHIILPSHNGNHGNCLS